MPEVIEKDAIYTVAEAAGLLRCSKVNLYNLIESKEIAYIQIGPSKGYRFQGADLLAFLAERKTGGATPKGSFKYLKR